MQRLIQRSIGAYADDRPMRNWDKTSASSRSATEPRSMRLSTRHNLRPK